MIKTTLHPNLQTTSEIAGKKTLATAFNNPREDVNPGEMLAASLGACMLTMTFLVVVCIFVPFGTEVTTRRLLGSVNGILHHIVCPLVSVISYIFFEDGVKTRRALLIPFTATAIYAFTVYTLNFLRLAEAPYPFFEVYDHPVPELIAWFVGLMAMITCIAAAVRLGNLAKDRKKK